MTESGNMSAQDHIAGFCHILQQTAINTENRPSLVCEHHRHINIEIKMVSGL